MDQINDDLCRLNPLESQRYMVDSSSSLIDEKLVSIN